MGIKNIIIIGGGGHAKVVIETAQACGYNVNAIVDMGKIGLNLLGIDIKYSDSDLIKLAPDNDGFIVGVGGIKNLPVRTKLYDEALALDIKPISLTHPAAFVSPSAKIGAGTIVLPGAVVHTEAVIGDNCIINSAAVIEHDAEIESHCHIAPGAVVLGNAKIGAGSFIGAGAVIKQGVTIGAGAIIAAGAIVMADIEAESTYAGIPAIRKSSR